VIPCSAKESLIGKIDKLKEALGGDDPKEVGECALQVFSESMEMAGCASPTEAIVRAIYDIILFKEPKEDVPDIVSGSGQYGRLKEDVGGICDFLLAMANGDLSKHLAVKGYLAGVLKMFQSHLRQLAWQARMVSRGDFTQRVNFMGEFSDSFNLMVEQLDLAKKRQAESEENYRLLAVTDSLTGLPNRRHFFEAASSEFARAKRYNKTFSIIMMDIDHFKKINDEYGHHAGDIVIQTVAQHLQKAMRGADILGRYGGEEFVALLPETTAREAHAVAERIRGGIQVSGVQTSAISIKVTASFGVSCFDSSIDRFLDIKEVIDRADKALYEAKHSGRNRVAVAD